jgi:hypothetical protein
MIKVAGALFLSFVFLATTSVSQTTSPSKPTKRKVMTGSAARGASSAGLKVAPDLDTQLAKFRRVQMPFDSKGLNSRERQMVEKLVLACKYLEDIFWRQNDPEGLTLYQSLAPSQNPRDVKLRRYVWINASRFDLLNDNRPFIGTEPCHRDEVLSSWTHPGANRTGRQRSSGQKAQLYSQFTVVRWHGAELEGLPYRIAYRSFLEPAAKALRDAAKLSDDAAFAKFLQLRADALLSDDYYPSDIAWLELKNPKFDLIFAPYETYLDGLLGIKGSFGAAVLVRNDAETQKLALFQKYVPDIQDALPLPAEDRPSKRGLETPMEVMDAPFRTGDLLHGYQAVADNLPNDPRVHEAKGSKKIFFKNFMDARVNYVILPVAKLLLRADQAGKPVLAMQSTVMHEIAHGLGPYSKTASGKVSIREAVVRHSRTRRPRLMWSACTA